MAKLGWTSSVGLAVGTAAGAAAAQFGLGYGLGIISWMPGQSGTSDEVWLASLAWTTFIAATSTVTGAVWADRRSAGEIGAPPRRPATNGRSLPPGAMATATWRTLIAFCAAVGALLSVALVLVPARAAVRAETLSPELIAVGYAVVGVVIGVLVAMCALAVRAITLNVLASAVWLWLLAIAAAINGVADDGGVRVAPLAVWPFGPGTYFRTTWSVAGMALMFGAALLIGAGVAWIATRRGDNAVGIALSGAVGPLMVAAAYLLTAPRLVGVRANAQISAYLTAPYAVIAGLAGSVLVVVLHANRDNRRARRAADEIEAASWTSSIVTAPMQRASSDAASASAPAGTSEEETVQLGGVGKDVPGRLPVPGPSQEVPGRSAMPGTSQPDSAKTSTDSGAVVTAIGPNATTGTSSDSSSRPSPRPGRKPGRR
jgi:hypothetical protein